MPNWCNNTITMSGPKDKIKKIWDNKGEGFLQQLYPMPKSLEDTTSPMPSDASDEEKNRARANQIRYGFDNWYDWRVNNWSTKWDVDTEGLEFVENNDSATIQGFFDSAWAPPIGAYDHFLANNEDCSISSMYYEGGMDFAGEWVDGCDTMINPSDYTADQMEDPDEGLIYELNEQFNFSEWVREYEEEQKTETEKFIVDKEPVNVG